jgi:transaldolase
VNRVAAESGDINEQIGAAHDRIAVLMREQNERPDDDEIARKIQSEFKTLRALQRERVSAVCQPSPAEETDPLIKKAREIAEHYDILDIMDEFKPKIEILIPRTDEEKREALIAMLRGGRDR